MQFGITFAVMVPAGLLGMLAFWAQKEGLLWLLLAVELAGMIALNAFLRRVVARRYARAPRTS